jgi:mannose-1-phosphate guanylyltransferase
MPPLVLPAGHVIKGEGAFTKAATEARPLAEFGRLVTFGIVPLEAHTSYGYIKKGKRMAQGLL